MIEQTVFYIFSALLLMSAGLMITVRNPVFAALFLILAFFSSSAIWLLLEAEFLAITLVLVYVGAVIWPRLHETLSVSKTIGILLILAGVFLVTRSINSRQESWQGTQPRGLREIPRPAARPVQNIKSQGYNSGKQSPRPGSYRQYRR